MNITGRCFVLAGLILFSLQINAQALPGDAALNRYYGNLDTSLANNRLSDIPFQQVRVRVEANDTLSGIAKRHTFPGLDFLHLVVAIFQTNPSAFENDNPALLQNGAIIQMPSVRDLIVAKDQYERLTIVGNTLSLFGNENVMRLGKRAPLDAKPDQLSESEIIARVAGRDALVIWNVSLWGCLLYTSPSPRDATLSRMPSSA